MATSILYGRTPFRVQDGEVDRRELEAYDLGEWSRHLDVAGGIQVARLLRSVYLLNHQQVIELAQTRERRVQTNEISRYNQALSAANEIITADEELSDLRMVAYRSIPVIPEFDDAAGDIPVRPLARLEIVDTMTGILASAHGLDHAGREQLCSLWERVCGL